MLDKYKKNRKNQWFRDAKLGKARYIFLRGFLGWGLPMFCVMMLVLPVIRGDESPFQIVKLATGFFIWGIGGLILGWITWRGNMKRHGLGTTRNGPR